MSAGSNGPSGLKSEDVQLRAERADDAAFLFELYCSTRQEELDSWGWPAAMRTQFLELQFRASQGYRDTFPAAEFQIVVVGGQSAGRLILNRSPEEWRVVDIALLPQHRGAGLGSALIQRVAREAAAADKPVHLCVLKGNRALRLYDRLGFVKIGETETHLELEYRAPVCAKS